MGFYRRIDVRMHGDKRFLSLSKPQPNGQTLFERCIHGPFTNGIGLYQIGYAGLSESLGWDQRIVKKLVDELVEYELVAFCETHRTLFVINFVKHNGPTNPNVLKGWSRVFDTLPECHLKCQWFQKVKLFSKQWGKWFKTSMLSSFRTNFATSIETSTTTTTTTTTTTKEEEKRVATEQASGLSVALDPALKAVLDECPELVLVNNGASAGFWDQVLGACEPYPIADGRWLGARVRAWNQWFASHPDRRSRKRGMLESRLMKWLTRDLEELARRG